MSLANTIFRKQKIQKNQEHFIAVQVCTFKKVICLLFGIMGRPQLVLFKCKAYSENTTSSIVNLFRYVLSIQIAYMFSSEYSVSKRAYYIPRVLPHKRV